MREGTKFAVVGGDLRQRALAELLQADGHETARFALGEPGEESLAQTLSGAQVLLLPLPAQDGEGYVNAPCSEKQLRLEEILDKTPPDALVCAGRVSPRLRQLAGERGLACIDYFDREELQVQNALITAEGALAILLEELPITLHQARVLVLGCGRIGKLLSARLQALGAAVSVSARRYGDMAWIRAMGCRVLDTWRLAGQLSGFDCLVNTVPARVLDAALLAQLAPGCLCLDLASKPGGMDFSAASRLGLRAIWALSLPGKTAPVSAGAALRDCVYHILEERGAAG